MKHTKTITLDFNGIEVKAMLTFNYTPEIKGVYTALPENSYPTEPEECELLTLVVEGNDCSWMLELIGDSLIEQLDNNND